MKSFVAVLSCLSAASAAVIPAAVGTYAYPQAYGYTAAAPIAYAGHAVAPAALPAAAPVAYANAALPAVYGGVYGATYDPSVAYANLCEY